jgi:catechol 2,3-dioxygenase-like lactoylglutathione lyase family enzyme
MPAIGAARPAVGIVVDDLAAATAFFIELGLELEYRCRYRWSALLVAGLAQLAR